MCGCSDVSFVRVLDDDLHPVWIVQQSPDNANRSEPVNGHVFREVNSSMVLPGFNVTEDGRVLWKGEANSVMHVVTLVRSAR